MSRVNREPQVLRAIYDYWLKNAHYPTTGEIAASLGIQTNQVCNIRRRLLKKGQLVSSALGEGFELSQAAKAAYEANRKSVISALTTMANPKGATAVAPTKPKSTSFIDKPAQKEHSEIILYGQVKAGPGSRADELMVYAGDENDTLAIPNAPERENVYALEVVGTSMLHDEIYPGDYVLVERANLLAIKDGDLIVARYLDAQFNDAPPGELDEAIANPDNLFGPTLKVFSRETRKSHIREIGSIDVTFYRLSWKTAATENERRIYTRYLVPDEIGRVIGIYREWSKYVAHKGK